MQLLQHEWRNSPDPSQREAAYAELTKMLGSRLDDAPAAGDHPDAGIGVE